MAKPMPANLGDVGAQRIATRAKAVEAPSAREASARESARLRKLSAFKLKPHRLQPLERHADANVAELMESIASLGLQEPPLVRRTPAGEYVILAGHRRVRAWQLLALDRRVEEKIRAFVLSDIDDRDEIYIIAAEYFHRREFSAVHTANVIGHAWRERAAELGREPTVRELESVIPWKRSSISNYMRIFEALEDPRLHDLVHSMDKQKALLSAVLSAEDVETRTAALEAFATGGASAARQILNGEERPVIRRDRKGGYVLTIHVKKEMPADDVRLALQELESVAAELSAKLGVVRQDRAA